MNNLDRLRCFNHPEREAVARCPECGRFFCRECITEHEDRVLCAQCLARQLKPKKAGPRRLGAFFWLIRGVLGLWIAWIFFYWAAKILLSIPSSFHEGVIWTDPLLW